MNKTIVTMLDRTVNVEVSDRARRQLDRLTAPLYVEMELYFSCLIRKRARVREVADAEFMTDVDDQLRIGFRPVMTKACSVTDTDEDGRPPLTDFPIKRPDRYIPDWLKLDYTGGDWQAEFGYYTPADA